MKICFFGIYNPEYSRNRVLISGFQENGFEVVQCRVDSGVGKFLKYWNLYKEYRKIKDEKFDYVIVAFPGHTVVWLARLLFGKEIIFDAFTSLYDSEVFDRKNVKEGSLKAGYLHFLDWSACRMASKVLLDTDEHIKYFVSEFKINRNKFIRVFVGTDTSVFYPREKVGGGDKFIVHFHGSNIPLQGIKVILESARILEQEKDIQFNIIGTKIKEEYESQNFKNVNFIDNVPYGELPGYISQADICLGIFGATEKTQRVIPNKVYECIAMKKPVITLDTPAVKELFSEGEEIRFLKDPESKELVGKIKELRSHLGSVEFRETFISPKKIVEDLISDLKELKIAIVTPIYKQDYLTDTVLDGLIQLQNRGEKIKFFISSNYKSRLPFKFPRLSEKKFIRFSEKADLILFMWGKNNTNYDLVNKINQWQKTIFIDGSELGGNKRLDNSINQSVLKGDYLGLGRVDKEMLEKCTLYFKREKPYLGEIHPFPFGIENSYLAYNKDIKKDIDFTCVFGVLVKAAAGNAGIVY
ncbi:glycosyltransferase, partial [Patescibacteria group bacterium]|nr:glycosyltransferase [Patescibacteria group bacterium]